MSRSSGARARGLREKQRRDALKEAIEGLQGKLLEHDESFRQEAQRRTLTKATRVAHTAKSLANEAEHWLFTKVEIVNQSIHTIEEFMAQNQEMKRLLQELANHDQANSPSSAWLREEAAAAVAQRPRNAGFHQGVGPLTALPLVDVPQNPANKKSHVEEASKNSTFDLREPICQPCRYPPGENPAQGDNLDQQAPSNGDLIHAAVSSNPPHPACFDHGNGNPVFVYDLMVMPQPQELPLHLRLADMVSQRTRPPAPSEASYSRLTSEQSWAPSSIAARRATTATTATRHNGRIFQTLMTQLTPTTVSPAFAFPASSLQDQIHQGLLRFLLADSNANLPDQEGAAARSLYHDQPTSSAASSLYPTRSQQHTTTTALRLTTEGRDQEHEARHQGKQE